MGKFKHWLLAVSMAANQFVNAVTGGDPDMSVSARAGFAREHGSKAGTAICRVLEFVDVHPFGNDSGDHCGIAMKHELERAKK